MYIVTQINNLEQQGELNTTFLLIDSNGIMPELRIEKTYPLNENTEKIIENDKIITCLFFENEFLNKKNNNG